MAVVSGITITDEQAHELMAHADGRELVLDEWPDGSVTLSDNDHIIVEFVREEE